GHVIDCSESKLRRSRGDWIGERERKEDAGEDSAKSLLLEIDKAGDAPLTLTVWARKAGIAMDNARSLAEKLATAGQIIALPGSRYASRAALEDAAANLIARLNDLHDARPLELGFEKKDILRVSGVAFRYSTSGTPESRMPRRGPGVLDKLLVDRAFDVLLADGRLIRDGLRYHLRGREPNLSPQERVLADRISSIYTHRGFTTPRPDELPGLIGADWPVIEPLVTHLLQTGELVRLNDKVLMHRSQVALSRDALLTYLATTGRLHSGDFKDILGTTRKYAIPLLEYWDRMGLTRRDGDDRVLREQPKEP
ncbi:MAG: SelB C-terminal domain-containing protein, partial [Phycisphaerae bacterium]|nr:SelB C-terminal domain-containing protein [Phycisphaerae bacterium]